MRKSDEVKKRMGDAPRISPVHVQPEPKRPRGEKGEDEMPRGRMDAIAAAPQVAEADDGMPRGAMDAADAQGMDAGAGAMPGGATNGAAEGAGTGNGTDLGGEMPRGEMNGGGTGDGNLAAEGEMPPLAGALGDAAGIPGGAPGLELGGEWRLTLSFARPGATG